MSEVAIPGGPGLCVHCTQGDVLPGEPKGTMVSLEGVAQAYFAASTSAPSTDGGVVDQPPPTGSSKNAIVLLTDVFGLPLKNSKLLADHFAEKVGCDVWVPDMFNGNPPFTVDDMKPYLYDTPGTKLSFFTKLSFLWKLITNIPKVLGLRDGVLDGRIRPFVQKLRDEKKYEKIGVVGYCLGGAAAIRLASSDLVDSAVVAHPGRCNINQIKAMKIPTSWVLAEDDPTFSPELCKEAEAVFAGRKGKENFVDYEFIEYKGTVHGFAARPNLAIAVVKEAFEKASGQTALWFEKTL